MQRIHTLLCALNLFALALAAPPLNSFSSLPGLYLLGDAPTNASTPTNLTLPTRPNLPADPTYYAIPQSDEQLKLWSYGHRIRKASVLGILQSMRRDVAFNVRKGNQMGSAPLHYDVGNVHLVIHVTLAMSWEVLGTMVRGLQNWFEKWEYVACDFDMGQVGIDSLFGTGALTQFDSSRVRGGETS